MITGCLIVSSFTEVCDYMWLKQGSSERKVLTDKKTTSAILTKVV